MATSESESAADTSEELSVVPNSTDPGWQYGYKGVKKNTVVCRLCGKKTSGGINRFKKHIAHIKGDVTACPKSTDEVKMVIREHLGVLEKKNLEKAPGHGRVSAKRCGKRSSEDAEDASSPSETDSAKFDSLPQIKRTKHLRNARRSKDDKKLDTDVFEAFLEDLWRKISEDKRKTCAYFDSLWFSLYKEDHTKAKVLQWIKNKDVFSRNYIFIPIVCWSHWSLLILCHFGEMNRLRTRSPCMLLLDSLLDAEPKRLEPDIRRFVLDIFESEGRTESTNCIPDIPLLIPKVPQQRNGDECGSYVLYFIYCFLESAPDNFTQEGYPHFLTEEWFTQYDFDNFSQGIESFSINKKRAEAESQEVDTAEYSGPNPVKSQIHHTGSSIIEID